LVKSVAGMNKAWVTIEALRPAISWFRVKSQTCCFQPYRAKAKTMLIVAAAEKI
jgi:DNA-binding transcriptional regulator YdaS (Cro superfamily)